MKIAYVIANHYKGFGGSENYSIYLAQEAISAGNEVLFVLGQESELSEELKRRNLKYVLVPMKSSFNPFLLIPSVLNLKKILQENRIEIVHTNMLREHTIALLAKLFGAGVRVVRTFHRLNQFNLKMKLLLPFYNRFTDGFIGVSRLMVSQMKEKGFNSDKIKAIYNGNPDYLVPRHQRAIGFLGRLSEEKGITKLIENNIDTFHNTELLVAGTGPEFEKLKKITTNNSNIKLLGPVNNHSDFFSKISLLIHPTQTESTIPLSVTEAFSAGIPVVIFDIPVLKDEEVEGLIKIETGNYQMMANKADEILNDEKILKELSIKARKSYENRFTVARLWSETSSLYQSLLN